MPLGGNKICLVKVCSEVSPERVECTDERSESGREFQIVGAAVWKEREPKIRLLFFSLCMRKTAIFLLPVKNRISPSCSPTTISYKMQEFWRFGHK